jgi:hypothetical protein
VGRAARIICRAGQREGVAGWTEFGPFDSCFFHNFCILASNELKPISKFF